MWAECYLAQAAITTSLLLCFPSATALLKGLSISGNTAIKSVNFLYVRKREVVCTFMWWCVFFFCFWDVCQFTSTGNIQNSVNSEFVCTYHASSSLYCVYIYVLSWVGPICAFTRVFSWHKNKPRCYFICLNLLQSEQLLTHPCIAFIGGVVFCEAHLSWENPFLTVQKYCYHPSEPISVRPLVSVTVSFIIQVSDTDTICPPLVSIQAEKMVRMTKTTTLWICPSAQSRQKVKPSSVKHNIPVLTPSLEVSRRRDGLVGGRQAGAVVNKSVGGLWQRKRQSVILAVDFSFVWWFCRLRWGSWWLAARDSDCSVSALCVKCCNNAQGHERQ